MAAFCLGVAVGGTGFAVVLWWLRVQDRRRIRDLADMDRIIDRRARRHLTRIKAAPFIVAGVELARRRPSPTLAVMATASLVGAAIVAPLTSGDGTGAGANAPSPLGTPAPALAAPVSVAPPPDLEPTEQFEARMPRYLPGSPKPTEPEHSEPDPGSEQEPQRQTAAVDAHSDMRVERPAATSTTTTTTASTTTTTPTATTTTTRPRPPDEPTPRVCILDLGLAVTVGRLADLCV